MTGAGVLPMDPDDVAVRVRRIIARTLRLGGLKAVHSLTRFHEDLEADSLDMVTLTMEAEEAFGIEIPDDVAARVSTVGEMVAEVERLLPADAVLQ